MSNVTTSFDIPKCVIYVIMLYVLENNTEFAGVYPLSSSLFPLVPDRKHGLKGRVRMCGSDLRAVHA